MGILRYADIHETCIYAPYSLEEGRSAIGRLDETVTLPSPSEPSPATVPAPAILAGS